MDALPPELYVEEERCPVCGRSFAATKVRLSRLEVLGRDTDLCVHYRGFNPYLYSVLVCPHCGYAALESQFHELTEAERRALEDLLRGRRPALDFGGERSWETGLAAYKLAIFQAERRGARPSVLAGLCLRAAWLLRSVGDARERDFLEAALNHYLRAHEREAFPVGRLSQRTVEYLIGELNLRLGRPEEAAHWFNRVASSRAEEDKNIVAMAREGWQRAREALRARPRGEGAGT